MKRFVIAAAALVLASSRSGVRAQEPPAEYQQVLTALGKQGDFKHKVLKVNIPRNDLAAFVGMDANAAIAGDVAMLESEVTPVLKALRQNGLDVVAIHHHMTRDGHEANQAGQAQPMIIFLHYWGTGPAEKLAGGFKAALDQPGHGASASRAGHK